MKKGNAKSKKSVHFNDQNLTEVKIFKSTDEPSAPNISTEEYMKIQEEVRKNPHIFKIEEIRKKEITMDINQQKEPELSWKFPHKIKLESDIELELNEEGKESQEKKYIQDFCDGQLRVRYFDEIPEPSEKEKMAIMFSFTDENIPKIENSQIATKTNDVTIEDVSNFWNYISQKNITKEDLSQLKELLGKAIDIDNDKKQQILEGAQKKYEQDNLINNQNYLNGNNNSININNNLTINNNQRILSMINFANPINPNNFNQMNPLANPALTLLNNLKQFPQNLQNIGQNNYPNIQQNYQTMTQNLDSNNLQKMSQPINPYPQVLQNLNLNYPQFDLNFSQQNNFQQQIQNTNNINNNNGNNNHHHHKSNYDQRMIMESAQRMNLSKYKTKPCRNYHSSTGCTRGDNCFFIHDPNFKGREIENFDPRNYQRDFPIQIGGFIPQTIMPGFGNQYMGQMGMGIQQMMGLAGNMGIPNMNNNMVQNNNEQEGMNRNNGFNSNQRQGMNLPSYDFGYAMQQGQ